MLYNHNYSQPFDKSVCATKFCERALKTTKHDVEDYYGLAYLYKHIVKDKKNQ